MCDVNAVCGVSVMPQILVTRMVSSHWTLQCFKHRHAVLPYHLCRQKCLYEHLSVFPMGMWLMALCKIVYYKHVLVNVTTNVLCCPFLARAWLNNVTLTVFCI